MPKLYIKNMVCDRCKAAVVNELQNNKIEFKSIVLGEVDIDRMPSKLTLEKLGNSLGQLGFELMEDRTAQLVNQIRSTIIEWVHGGESKSRKEKFSSHLANALSKDYAFLSNLFSAIENITIEQYLILQKTERVKELLVYGEHTLNQIADELNYSSVQHLSSQFKKITGLTPSHFKKLGAIKRLGLDKV